MSLSSAQVASHAEAWIETLGFRVFENTPLVASHAEAWIETTQKILMQMVALSPLMQRRGLKHQHGWRLLGGVESPLMQRRGLKLQYALKVRTEPLSPLMQRRGLKQFAITLKCHVNCVASHAEAWIETVK